MTTGALLQPSTAKFGEMPITCQLAAPVRFGNMMQLIASQVGLVKWKNHINLYKFFIATVFRVIDLFINTDAFDNDFITLLLRLLRASLKMNNLKHINRKSTKKISKSLARVDEDAQTHQKNIRMRNSSRD